MTLTSRTDKAQVNISWTLKERAYASIISSILFYIFYNTLAFTSPSTNRGSCLGDGCLQMVLIVLIAKCIIVSLLFLGLIKRHRAFSLMGVSISILLPIIYVLLLSV